MILSLVAGLVFLIVGAEALVRGASRIAAALGIPPLIVGLTVVAFGTSAPELAVSIKASLAGQAGIALGNVVGSNIFNVLFILGVSALIVPLAVSRQLIRLDVPLMILASGLTWILCLDGRLGRVDGLLLLGGLVAYLAHLMRAARKEPPLDDHASSVPRGMRARLLDTALIIGGLALLVLGSRWLVQGAVQFAQQLGVSELVIGLTIVAAGTSLPEVVTSIVASIRGQRDIAVGNVVGSNLFNLMAVLGASGVISGAIPVPQAALTIDIPVMFGAALICLPIFFTGKVISRLEGAFLLVAYVAYTLFVIRAGTI